MRQLAKQLGVSIATVSRALNHDPRVKPETRERIERLAEELGYEPDPALSALNAYRHESQRHAFRGTLAWLTNYPEPEGWRSVPTSVRLHDHLKDLAPKRGYNLDEFWLNADEMPARRLDQVLRSRGVRGIFLSSLPVGVNEITFPWEGYSVVSLSETVQRPQTHSIQKSTYFDVRRCVRRLAEAGYRRPILAVHDRFHRGMQGVHEGAFYAATQEYLGYDCPCHVAPIAELYQRVKGWARDFEADCLISSLAPPLDYESHRIPWIGFTGDLYPGHQAAIVHDFRNLAKAALDIMVVKIQHSEFGLPEAPLILRIAGKWMENGLQRQA